MRRTNAHAARGAGKGRRPFLIREELSLLGMTMADVARELGVHPSLVEGTVKGINNNRRVLTRLLELGVPKRALSLPADMQDQHAAPPPRANLPAKQEEKGAG